MSFLEVSKKFGTVLLDMVFPITCLVCGKDGTFLCEPCLSQLPRLENQVCLVCYKPAPFGKTHPTCVTRNSVDGAVAALTYKDKRVHHIIQTFKYNFVSDLSIPLSRLIVEAMDKQNLSEFFSDFIIIPVPLHPRRFNWRGFNQSELLATALSEKLNIRIAKDLVKRKKFTQPQVKLNQEERKKNLENAFELTSDITDKKILLVDDLVTSGATANELAKLFKQAKASEIWVLSVAHG